MNTSLEVGIIAIKVLYQAICLTIYEIHLISRHKNTNEFSYEGFTVITFYMRILNTLI